MLVICQLLLKHFPIGGGAGDGIGAVSGAGGWGASKDGGGGGMLPQIWKAPQYKKNNFPFDL